MRKEIKGSNFVLRRLRPIEDKDSIFENINNEKILNKITLEYPYSDESYNQFVDVFEKQDINQDLANFSFIIDVGGKAVGAISLMGKSKLESIHRTEIGYWLGEKYWNRGIVSEAVKIICDFAFNDLNKMKITISALEDNIGSIKVAEKNGFKLEYIKKKEAFKEGKYKDLVCYTKFKYVE